MSLDSTRWGDSIAAAISAIGITAGTKITDVQLKEVWRAIKGEDKTEISSNADINLSSSDITSDVPALGLLDSFGQPVTGQATGVNQSVILSGKIE